MAKIRLPGGGVAFHLGSEEDAEYAQKKIDARAKFVEEYCRKKGWPLPHEDSFAALDIDKILEIREQPGWKDPLNEQN